MDLFPTLLRAAGGDTDSYELETHAIGGGCYAGITAKMTANGGAP